MSNSAYVCQVSSRRKLMRHLENMTNKGCSWIAVKRALPDPPNLCTEIFVWRLCRIITFTCTAMPLDGDQNRSFNHQNEAWKAKNEPNRSRVFLEYFFSRFAWCLVISHIEAWAMPFLLCVFKELLHNCRNRDIVLSISVLAPKTKWLMTSF